MIGSREAALAALEWQVELGADDAVGEAFIDRFATPEPATTPKQSRPKASGPDAAQAARDCDTLEALRMAVAAYPSPLKENARNCVFADGNPAARVMIIGEAPGRDEDAQGLPFVGRSGQLLDKMFAAIGMARTAEDPAKAIYIANILPWRPPGNRTPSVAEALEFRPFILRHIALIKPALIITMGNVSTKTLLDVETGITRMRGTWAQLSVEGKECPVLPMLHPAYLLRQPLDKRKTWADLLALKSHLEGTQ